MTLTLDGRTMSHPLPSILILLVFEVYVEVLVTQLKVSVVSCIFL